MRSNIEAIEEFIRKDWKANEQRAEQRLQTDRTYLHTDHWAKECIVFQTSDFLFSENPNGQDSR